MHADPGSLSAAPLAAGDALIVVDVQNDFITGSLAVAGAAAIVPLLDRCIAAFTRLRLPVVVTRDWHPADHCSFREQGGPWPAHCVAGTAGAAFAPGLTVPADAMIVSKATEPRRENYSDFAGTGLGDRLRALGVQRVFIGGLATDYCVLNTVRDALQEGFAAFLLADAIRAVNVNPDDGAKAITAMAAAGAVVINADAIAPAPVAAAARPGR